MKNVTKIILSFVFVVGISFLTHFMFVKNIQQSEGRQVANFGERDSAGQIKWEQKIAQELSNGAGYTQSATKPSWHDLLVYEYLAGRYNVSMTQGQVQTILLQDAAIGINFKTKEFVETFGRKIKTFSSYRLNQLDGSTEEISLIDQSGQGAGSFTIKRNDQGLVQAVDIK